MSKKAGHRCLELKKNARNSKEQKLCAIKWGMFTDSVADLYLHAIHGMKKHGLL